MAKDLSVIIVNYNTRDLVNKCIESVVRWSDGLIIEIIVIDNDSKDGSVVWLQRYASLPARNASQSVAGGDPRVRGFQKIKVIRNNENLGFAKAVNQGIKNSKGKYILLLNSDTIIKKDTLKNLVEFAKKHNDNVVVAPRLLNPDGSPQASCFHFPTIKAVLSEIWLEKIGSYSKYIPIENNPVSIDAAVGAAMLIPKKIINKVGSLDKRYFMYMEDIDFCRRVWKSGFKVYYLPTAEVIHTHGASGKKRGANTNNWSIISSKIYHGTTRHYLITFIWWTGQTWKNNKPMILIFATALLLRFLLIPVAMHGDMLSNADWGIRFFQYGPNKYFAPDTNVWSFLWPNQPPLTIYMFAAIRKIYEAIYSMMWFFNTHISIFPSKLMYSVELNWYYYLLKLPSVVADLGIGWIIYRLAKIKLEKKNAIFVMAIWLFNPITFYNSAIWGQTDAVINLISLVALVLAIKKKFLWATLTMAASLLFKASLFTMLPLLLVYLLSQKITLKKWLLISIAILIFVVIIFLPFVYQNNPLSWIYHFYRDKVLKEQLHYLTSNAFNFWGLISGMSFVPDTAKYLWLTVNQWSWFVWLLVNTPFLLQLYRRPKTEYVALVGVVMTFSSFIIFTNMHERYLFPAIPLLLWSSVYYPELRKAYYLVSAIHLVNLYHWWWEPRVQLFISILTVYNSLVPRILSGINTVILIWFLWFAWTRLRGDKIDR